MTLIGIHKYSGKHFFGIVVPFMRRPCQRQLNIFVLLEILTQFYELEKGSLLKIYYYYLVTEHLNLLVMLCPTLYDPMDCSPSGSFVYGILQARILEWVAISSSRESSQPRD